jgi:MAPEG family
VSPFRRKQLVGIAGALPAFVAVALTLDHAKSLFAFLALPADDLAARLAFAARWMLLPGFCLLLGIVVAARRGFVPDAIEGTRTPASQSLEINLRYNQNTLEQTVLACIAWAGLAIKLPSADLLLIPAMAALFVTGRAAFWIGYLFHPMGRSFGMVLTVLPTLASYGWLAWQANDVLWRHS